jgi:hypothetical protein
LPADLNPRRKVKEAGIGLGWRDGKGSNYMRDGCKRSRIHIALMCQRAPKRETGFIATA